MKIWAAAAALCLGVSAVFAADSPDVKKFSFPNGVEVYSIRDKDSPMKGTLFSDATKASDFKKSDLKKEYPASVNVFVLRANEKLFLIDGGNYDPKTPLITKLESVKIRPKNIDYILITHLHPDHVGGLIDKDGNALFPNAVVHVSYEEWKYWSPIIAKQKSTEILRRFRDAYSSRIRSLNFGEPTASSVFSMKANGHTPGHCFYRQGKLRFVGDIVHAVDLQTAHPEYGASFDSDPKQAYLTRSWFLETVCKDGNIIFGAHIPFPGVGTIVKKDKGYAFEPYAPQK